MRGLSVILSLCLTGAVCFAGATLYVDDNAPNDPGPGDPLVSDPAEDGSQAHPFDAIQKAIDAAANGDEVIILPGTYTGQGNRDIDFKGKPITVRGTNPDDPNTVAATIIDCQGTEAEPHRGFYFHNGEAESSVLSGIMVMHGYADKGGGILCVGSHPKIIRCTIQYNTATNTDGAHAGGGVHYSNSNGTIVACKIEGNHGGGIACYMSSPTISDCSILRNSARSGGGIFSFSGNPVISGCVITDNEAQVGGGGINCAPKSVATISGCTITANRALGGGGLACSGDTTITGCVIAGNVSLDLGGAFTLRQSSITIANCTIVGNRAAKKGGGIYGDDVSATIVNNSILWGNTAPSGNQISLLPSYEDAYSREITLRYCAVQGGKAGTTGGVVYWQQGNIDADPLFADPGRWHDNGTPEDSSDDTWVDGDYHLRSRGGRWDAGVGAWVIDEVGSPCVDAGDPASDYSDEPFFNGGRINMGAYGGTAYASRSGACLNRPIGDLNGDCRVTFADLALLGANWLDCNLDPPTACE